MTGRPMPDLAEVGAVALVDLAAEMDPTFPRTAEMHAAAAALIQALAAALAAARG